MAIRIDMDDGTADRDAHEDGHVYGAHESSWGALRLLAKGTLVFAAGVAFYALVRWLVKS